MAFSTFSCWLTHASNSFKNTWKWGPHLKWGLEMGTNMFRYQPYPFLLVLKCNFRTICCWLSICWGVVRPSVWYSSESGGFGFRFFPMKRNCGVLSLGQGTDQSVSLDNIENDNFPAYFARNSNDLWMMITTSILPIFSKYNHYKGETDFFCFLYSDIPHWDTGILLERVL